MKINKELVDDNNNLTEALKKTYADISAVIFNTSNILYFSLKQQNKLLSVKIIYWNNK